MYSQSNIQLQLIALLRDNKEFISVNITGSPFFSQRMCGLGLPLAEQDMV